MKNRFYFSSYYLQGVWYEIQKHAKINNAEAFGLYVHALQLIHIVTSSKDSVNDFLYELIDSAEPDEPVWIVNATTSKISREESMFHV